MPYSPQVLQTSSESLKVTIQTYRMENRELKVKLRQLQEEISKHLCQLVLI